MGNVGNRVAELIEKERKRREADGKTYTLQDVAYETRLAYNTVLDWFNNKIKRYDGATLAVLCDYFKVGPGDILVYDADKDADS